MTNDHSPLRYARAPRVDGLLLQVQPHEASHFFAHERRPLAVDLAVLFGRLLPGLRFAGRVQRGHRRLEVLLPACVLLLEVRVTYAFRRGNEGDAVPDEEVEFAVAIHVSDPDPSRMRGASEVALAEGLSLLDRGPRLDQQSKWFEVRHLALGGLVPRPVDAAVAGPAHQVQASVAVQVDNERIAVRALDSQRRMAGLDQLRRRQELAIALPLEPVERAGEVPH